MKILLCAIFLIASLSACRSSDEATQMPIDVTVSTRADPEPPAVGASTLHIALHNADGTPVDNARLNIRGNMDHAGMAPIIREVSSSVNGEYTVPFEWTMGGGWIVTVTATLPDGKGEISQEFEFFVEAISRDSIIHQMPGSEATPEATAEDSGG